MNRPEKRNSLIHPLRGAILETLRAHDQDPDVSVTIIRGAGPSFSAGYDLGGGNEGHEMPYYTPGGEGAWPRHVTEGWMSIWDLAKPVIAQVHGYCLAGASELATGCDLVYMAEDAQMGYPAVRFGVPDMHFHPWFLGMRKAMEMMLTGDSISGIEAVELRLGQRGLSRRRARRARARGRGAHRDGAAPSCCSSTSASCTGRWTRWDCGPASAPAPSCARSERTPTAMREFIGNAAREGPHERAAGTRRAVRRLPHERGLTATREGVSAGCEAGVVANSAAEIAFEQVMRGVDGQAWDLASIRRHLNIILTAGGLAAAFLGAGSVDRGWSFWLSVVAFGLIALITIRVYWPVDWFYDFDGYELINEYVDTDPSWSAEQMARELTIHAAEKYLDNRRAFGPVVQLRINCVGTLRDRSAHALREHQLIQRTPWPRIASRPTKARNDLRRRHPTRPTSKSAAVSPGRSRRARTRSNRATGVTEDPAWSACDASSPLKLRVNQSLSPALDLPFLIRRDLTVHRDLVGLRDGRDRIARRRIVERDHHHEGRTCRDDQGADRHRGPAAPAGPCRHRDLNLF